MQPVTIDNPILNSPYSEPTRHFPMDDAGQIAGPPQPGRRGSSYFLPIAAPKKKGAPGLFDKDYAGEKKTEAQDQDTQRESECLFHEPNPPCRCWLANNVRRSTFESSDGSTLLDAVPEPPLALPVGEDKVALVKREGPGPLGSIFPIDAEGIGLGLPASPHDARST